MTQLTLLTCVIIFVAWMACSHSCDHSVALSHSPSPMVSMSSMGSLSTATTAVTFSALYTVPYDTILTPLELSDLAPSLEQIVPEHSSLGLLRLQLSTSDTLLATSISWSTPTRTSILDSSLDRLQPHLRVFHGVAVSPSLIWCTMALVNLRSPSPLLLVPLNPTRSRLLMRIFLLSYIRSSNHSRTIRRNLLLHGVHLIQSFSKFTGPGFSGCNAGDGPSAPPQSG